MNKYGYMFIGLVLLTSCTKQPKPEQWTSSMEGRGIKVSCLMGGKITALTVNEGDAVALGDTIAVLDSREIKYQLEQLSAGKDEISAQESLFRTQIASAQNDLKYYTDRETRTQNLFEADAVPRQNVDDSAMIRAKAQNQATAAKQNLALLDAKRKQLAAQEKTLQKKLADSVILAPSAGVVSSLYYHLGEVVPPLGQIAELMDTSSLETSIYVGEKYLARLKPGMTATLKLSNYPKPIIAKIIHISNKAEFTPKTVLTPENRSVMVYAVRLRADNPDGVLKDGMPVDVSFP